ncbi:formyltetrahydrofolate deformylase [Oligoflexus tunisiensis]|uniref:formyltetrahydrofolate deformylase n=1 Tax=Oligoflexus tunisiensis TaxID=708132 RepID=UPI000A993734|nr:formyltetrahydrofolate deformylase [Oligoflexus tunisiensis]
MESVRAILLASCRDQRGVVARLSRFIYERNGNITDADQHRDPEADIFCTRLEWELDGFRVPRDQIAGEFAATAQELGLTWSLHFTDKRPRVSIWVSKQDHCLIDLLGRQRSGDLRADIGLIISNHAELESIAEQFHVPFVHLPITPTTKAAQEQRALELLRWHQIDLVVLAKYMQVLSPDFLKIFPQVINIHHSFLPAFPGASPYHQAFSRGVKIIGATAHYVTQDLDEGPIIEQDVGRVSHRDSVKDLVRKGKDLEKIVLARAVYQHVERRVLVYGNKTVVFD